MGKARVLKHQTKLLLLTQEQFSPLNATIDFSNGVFLGEVDSFTYKSRTKVVNSRPVGYILEGSTLDYGGWDLSFDGGKVNWDLALTYWLQENSLRAGYQPPKFVIIDRVVHYNGAWEEYIYFDVVFFEMETNGSDERTESISAFSPYREPGITSTIALKDPVGTTLKHAIFKANFEKG